MIWLRLIPVILSLLVLCAHYLRGGDYAMIAFWLAAPLLLIFKRNWSLRAFQLLLVVGAGIWIDTMIRIMHVRLDAGMPWLRMAIILGIVAALAAGSALILNAKSIKIRFIKKNDYSSQSLAAFIITFAILTIVQFKVSFPVILAERFIHKIGWLEILILSTYAAVLVEKMMDVSQTAVWRKRIWLIFSIVFFAQFIIGLSGVEKFLMTGKLHIPVPAIIIGGPIYRGSGFFMPVLFISTLVLVGPAWCSYLCYIGSWDHRASLAKRKPKQLPRWRHAARVAILLLVPAAALILRALGASIATAALFGIVFGMAGVAIMIVWSRRAGAMSHCITWCPIGLIANWLGKISPFRLRINNTCNDCGACALACRYEALTVQDIQNRKPGLTCTLCGDCILKCREDSIEYRFLKLKPVEARALFIIMVVSIHAVFMGLARL